MLNPITDKSGLYKEIPFQDYLSWPGVSKHDLDLVAKSPAHFLAQEGTPLPVTPAMRFGTACHTAILEPNRLMEDVAVLPSCDRRTKAGKELAAAFEAESSGKTVISQEEMRHINEMSMSVLLHPVAGPLITNATHIEASATWEDVVTGERCRCRPDAIHPDLVVDLKTTIDASRWAFASSMHKYRYHVQAAYYLSGLKTLGVIDETATFVFLVVEKKPPYGVALYAVQQEDLRRGELQYERDLMRYAQCKKENHWPGYSESIGYIDLPIFSRREIDAFTGNH